MKLDTSFPPNTPLSDYAEFAPAAEKIGFDAIWSAETQHNPFLPGVLIAEHTQKIQFGTAIAVSFARSPAVMAHTAWDLANYSKGRFMLGLGTQVKAHITRRFGMDWPESVVGKQREQINGIRAFWNTWQNKEPLNQRGEYYKLTLTSPFFTPDAIDYPNIPIHIAGVNTGLAHLAGEVADGFHVHPFNTPEYLKDIILPAIESGTAKSGRSRQDISMVVSAFVISDEKERETVRQQISFYASTPSYRKVLAHHGWDDVGEKLSKLASRQKWAEMTELIDDNILETVATVASPADLADALQERYKGLADRLVVYIPFIPGERDAFWQELRKGFSK